MAGDRRHYVPRLLQRYFLAIPPDEAERTSLRCAGAEASLISIREWLRTRSQPKFRTKWRRLATSRTLRREGSSCSHGRSFWIPKKIAWRPIGPPLSDDGVGENGYSVSNPI